MMNCRMINRKGFMLLDTLVSSSIFVIIVIMLASFSFLSFKILQGNNRMYRGMIVVENHLAELSSLSVNDWYSLDGTKKQLTNNVQVQYQVNKTGYMTTQLNVIFDICGTDYSFYLERSDFND